MKHQSPAARSLQTGTALATSPGATAYRADLWLPTYMFVGLLCGVALSGASLTLAAPAAAVAIASLMQAVEAKSVDRHSTVMLNVTGGGFKRLWKEVGRVPITPDLVIGRDEISPGRISARLNGR